MYEHALFVKRVLYKETQNMKKKIALLLPAFFLALSLGACNGKKSNTTPADNSGNNTQQSGNEQQSGGNQGGESGGEQSGGEQSGGEQSGGEQSGGEQTPATPEDGRVSEAIATGASMQIGSRYYALTEYAETMGSPVASWMKADFVAEANEAVSFYVDGTKLDVFSDGDSNGNNITEDHPMTVAVNEVHIKTGGTLSVYLKQWTDSYTFWITGAVASGSGEGQGSGENQQGAVTYTCTNLPDWITNDGCVIFAWVWSTNDAGSWKACTYGEPATSLTFETSEELSGFLLARCIAGTTQPDWAIHDNSVGRVYNQTENIDCVAGTYSYACAEWKAYN